MNRRRPKQIVKFLRKAEEEMAKGKALEVENATLKRMLAEAMLANEAMREFLPQKA